MDCAIVFLPPPSAGKRKMWLSTTKGLTAVGNGVALWAHAHAWVCKRSEHAQPFILTTARCCRTAHAERNATRMDALGRTSDAPTMWSASKSGAYTMEGNCPKGAPNAPQCKAVPVARSPNLVAIVFLRTSWMRRWMPYANKRSGIMSSRRNSRLAKPTPRRDRPTTPGGGTRP